MRLNFGMVLSFLFLFLASCAQKDAGDKNRNENQKQLNTSIAKVLEAHGGMDAWNKQQTLSFELGDQTHTIDLHSREVKIAAPAFTIGNDSGTVWIKQDTTAFESSPRFYHSLMFYFYTVPFVFADDGINYEKMPAKTFKDTKYQALKMSFDEGVGDAPKDEYIIYYHPDTHKMEWMAYTSTYRTQEKSDDFGLIHYKTWQEANGFLLPIELQWYQYENGEVGDPRGEARKFTNVSVSEEEMGDEFYSMPEGAEVDSSQTE